jgi:hypothetical protein
MDMIAEAPEPAVQLELNWIQPLLQSLGEKKF